MQAYHVDKPDATIKKIISETFPSYTGRTIKIAPFSPMNMNSNWDGGTRYYFKIYSLDDGRILDIPENHPFWTGKNYRLDKLPPRFVIVEHCIFCGKDHGITIIANPEDLAPMLPKSDDITQDERIVLTFTKCYKASYGGVSNLRYKEARRVHQISSEAWETAKTALIARGLLDKRGAITANGRNSIAGNEAKHF